MKASKALQQSPSAVNPTPRVEKSHAVGNSKSLGGGIPCGYLPAIPECGCERLVLFNSCRTHSTYALPASQLSARSVRRHIAEHDALFTSEAKPKVKSVCHQFNFHLADHGSIYILTPLNAAAIAWVEENVGRESGFHPDYPTLVIERHYMADLIDGIYLAGMDISTGGQR